MCRIDQKLPREKIILSAIVFDHLPSIERIYAMRKKAVGLLGNAKGAAKPIPFVEDDLCAAGKSGGLHYRVSALY